VCVCVVAHSMGSGSSALSPSYDYSSGRYRKPRWNSGRRPSRGFDSVATTARAMSGMTLSQREMATAAMSDLSLAHKRITRLEHETIRRGRTSRLGVTGRSCYDAESYPDRGRALETYCVTTTRRDPSDRYRYSKTTTIRDGRRTGGTYNEYDYYTDDAGYDDATYSYGAYRDGYDRDSYSDGRRFSRPLSQTVRYDGDYARRGAYRSGYNDYPERGGSYRSYSYSDNSYTSPYRCEAFARGREWY